MKRFFVHIALFLLIFVSVGNLAEAVSAVVWQNSKFIGLSKSDALKLLGQPDKPAENPGDMDSWLVPDSPTFMMAGMLEYKNDKVVAVFALCHPEVAYEKLKEVQLQSPDITVVFDDNRGLLCKYKKPQPGGPVFIGISTTNDPKTGPLFCESIANPFGGSESTTSEAAPVSQSKKNPKAAAPDKKFTEADHGLLLKDVFDWGSLDDAGKIALLNQIKKLWRAHGYENDGNAVEAKALLERFTIGDQGNVMESACKAAGIDPAPFLEALNSGN